MNYRRIVLAFALVLTVILIVAAARYPYFAGDIAATKFVQSIAGPNVGWAQTVTLSARPPWSFILSGVTVILSWLLGGWRAALLSIASFAGMSLLGPQLSTLIARPRPSPALVHVTSVISGYSFPSIFALVYSSTIGYLGMLALKTQRGQRDWLGGSIFLVSCLILLIGGSARIILGAHWPSDVLISYLIALLWAAILLQFYPREHKKLRVARL